MSRKIIWWVIIGLILLAIPFLIGLLGNFGEASGYEGLNSMFLALCYGALLILAGGIAFVIYFKKRKGAKGILIGILIALALIPLVFLGSCLLSVGGLAVKDLIIK